MSTARIFQRSKTAMQSGRAKTRRWVLEFERQAPKRPDPLMGWLGSTDTQSQVQLTFDSREDAIAYAERNGIKYRVHDKPKRVIRPKSYAENFT